MHFRQEARNMWIYTLSQPYYALTVGLALAAPKWIISVSSLWCVCWVKAGGTTSSSAESSGVPLLPSCPLNQTTMNNHNSLGSWHIQLFIDLYGVVINFLPVTGPGHNILRLEAACSPAINHENQGRAELFLLYHLELFTAAMIRADGGRGDRRVLRKHETHLYVTDCYSVFVFLGPPTNCAITLVTYATYKDGWFAWSIGIDPTEVSSMKLILFIVYVSTDGPWRRTRRSPPLTVAPA